MARLSSRRVLLCAVLLSAHSLRMGAAVRFGLTGMPQEYIVPAGVTSIKVIAAGARGGPGSDGGTALMDTWQC
jgi:hypothetical protein